MKKIFMVIINLILVIFLVSCKSNLQGNHVERTIQYIKEERSGAIKEKHTINNTDKGYSDITVTLKSTSNGLEIIVEQIAMSYEKKVLGIQTGTYYISSSGDQPYSFKYSESLTLTSPYSYTVTGSVSASNGELNFTNEVKTGDDYYNVWSATKSVAKGRHLKYIVKTMDNKIPKRASTSKDFGFS